jgi:hypothetical protein
MSGGSKIICVSKEGSKETIEESHEMYGMSIGQEY